MKNNTILVIGLGAVLALGSIGFNWVEVILPTAEAHGVQAQLQSRFVKIQNEVFNGQSFATGEQLCLEGELQSLVERDLRAWVSIFSESTNAGNRWEIQSREPPGNVFDIEGNEIVPYKICAMALEPGVETVQQNPYVAEMYKMALEGTNFFMQIHFMQRTNAVFIFISASRITCTLF